MMWSPSTTQTPKRRGSGDLAHADQVRFRIDETVERHRDRRQQDQQRAVPEAAGAIDGAAQAVRDRLLDELGIEVRIGRAHELRNDVTAAVDDERHAIDAGGGEIVDDVRQNRFAGDMDQRLRDGVGVGPQARALTRHRNDGFQRAILLMDAFRTKAEQVSTPRARGCRGVAARVGWPLKPGWRRPGVA